MLQAFGMIMQCTAASFPTSMAGKDLRFSFAREVEVSEQQRCQLAIQAFQSTSQICQPGCFQTAPWAPNLSTHPSPFPPPSSLPQSMPNGVKVGVASSINYRRMIACDNK